MTDQEEIAWLMEDLRKHRMALKALRLGDCWCEFGLNNPNYRSHTTGCELAKAAMDEWWEELKPKEAPQ